LSLYFETEDSSNRSETVAPGTTMVELHSNVAAEGGRRTVDHVLRTQGAFHETLDGVIWP
jgi:hypothetical protein